MLWSPQEEFDVMGSSWNHLIKSSIDVIYGSDKHFMYKKEHCTPLLHNLKRIVRSHVPKCQVVSLKYQLLGEYCKMQWNILKGQKEDNKTSHCVEEGPRKGIPVDVIRTPIR